MNNATNPEGQQITLLADLVLTAGDRVPTISIEAYNGSVMQPTINGKAVRAVVDLAGLVIDSQRKPILKGHDHNGEVGHTESITNDGMKLTATGIASGEGPAAQHVIGSAKKRFPWKASISVDIHEAQLIAEGQSVRVNGRNIAGPFVLVKRSTLKEISAVSIGGDDSTSLSIAASAAGVIPMDQTDPTVETAPVSAGAATAIDSPQTETPKPAATLQAAAVDTTPADIIALRAAHAAESRRIGKINELLAQYRGPESVKIGDQAISEGWAVDTTELKLLRAARPKAPAAIIGGAAAAAPDVLSAAICLGQGLRDIDKKFDAKTLDAADKNYRGGLSIQRLLLESAHANGYSGGWFWPKSNGESEDILRAAFSTRTITGVLSNTANKFLLEGYTFVDQSWRAIAAIRPVSDFKTITSYRLTDSLEFEEVAPDGHIPHGTLGEQNYTNRAKTYAKMLGITRTDIINDDLGVLSAIPRQLGRGSALKLNNVFWTLFKANATLFSDSNTPDNLAAQTLDVAGLTVVNTQFLTFTDPNGVILGARPAILLVPPALEIAALTLMNSTSLVGGGSTVLNLNPFAGRFKVVVSPYLTDTNAWYLLADPRDIPTIEVVFLNGVQTPTVETADVNFSQLGIEMRGYHDFGVAIQDARGGIYSNPS